MNVRAPDVAHSAAVTEAIKASNAPQSIAPLAGPGFIAWSRGDSLTGHANNARQLVALFSTLETDAERLDALAAVSLRLAAIVELATVRYEVTSDGAAYAAQWDQEEAEHDALCERLGAVLNAPENLARLDGR